jgi:hypothetical protein
MKQYIKHNWLVILGWLAFIIGLVLQAGIGKIDGSALIPLPLIYFAMLLRGGTEGGHADV